MDIENEQRRCKTQALTVMACLFFCVRLCMYVSIKNPKTILRIVCFSRSIKK
jgi:hypothetical protein